MTGKSLRVASVRLVAVLCFGILASAIAFAQSSGIVRGQVTDVAGADVTGATATLTNATNGYTQTQTTDTEGRFQFFNVPFNSYTLTIEQAGFTTAQQTIELRSNVPTEVSVALAVGAVSEQVEVQAGASSVEARSEYTVNQTTVNRLTGALASRQIENVVLSAPGIAKDENGRFHPRGGHYQASFVIDGIPVSDQLSTVFANSFDARNVEAVDIQTGNIAPEFGNKVSAVIQVATESGLGSNRPVFGEVNVGGGSFNAGEASIKLGGQNKSGSFGYLVSGATNFSSRFLDPALQNATADFGSGALVTAGDRGLHNYGNSQNLFARFDYVMNDRNFFKLNIASGRTRLDVPNLPSQQLNGQDQVQQNRDLSIYPSFLHIFNERWAMTVAPYLRIATSHLRGSAGDTPINSDYERRLTTAGVVANASYTGNAHRLKLGIDAFAFPSRERFRFQITSPNYNPLPDNFTANINADGTVSYQFDPSLSDQEIDELLNGFNPNLIAYDRTVLQQAAANGSTITGTPRAFASDESLTGKEFSAYVQDTYTYRNLTVSGGLRFDHYRFLVSESVLSPRIGVAYSIPSTGTVLRASYNRINQTPSSENLLTSESPRAASLLNPNTVAIFGAGIRRNRIERANWFEVGVGQRLGRVGRIDAAYYRKRIRDFQDNDQFLNTTIVFPISISRGRIDGFDFRFESARRANFSGYVSLGTVRAIAQPPFSGGLFLSSGAADTFGAGAFRIDHDQKLNLQTALQYDNAERGLFGQFLVRYDSGLVTEIENVADVAADPDLAPGLRFVNFSDPETTRVRRRTVMDLSLGYDFIRRERTRAGLQFDLLNLTNEEGLYNFLSVFSGTHFIAPRSYNLRFKYSF